MALVFIPLTLMRSLQSFLDTYKRSAPLLPSTTPQSYRFLNTPHNRQVADQYAKSAATGEEPVEAIPEGYAAETSLSHMTRVAKEARSKETRE